LRGWKVGKVEKVEKGKERAGEERRGEKRRGEGTNVTY